MAFEETVAHDLSPRCNNLRNRAAENLAKKGQTIKSKRLKKLPELVIKEGDVVLVPLDGVNRTKVDGGNTCGIVFSTNKLNSTCKVVVKQGLLCCAYVYHSLKLVPKASNDMYLTDLCGM